MKLEFEKFVECFYIENRRYIEKMAENIISFHYSIPLEFNDLISYAIYKILEPETKVKYFELKKQNEDINKYLKRRIKIEMLNYCNIYKSKNHQILNKSIFFSVSDENEINNHEENYNYEELFSFLSLIEFQILYQIYVLRISRISIAKKLKISKFKIRKIEGNALEKIYRYYK